MKSLYASFVQVSKSKAYAYNDYYCRLGSQSRTSLPTIRLTESGLASIASFYPATSVDAESGLNSTRQVVESELDDANTVIPAPTT
jgi:hypothetical protein